jgi:hypothetical protein
MNSRPLSPNPFDPDTSRVNHSSTSPARSRALESPNVLQASRRAAISPIVRVSHAGVPGSLRAPLRS